MATWDPTKVKSQIRLTAYRLSQLRQRHDQTSPITKSDIATLIGKGDVDTARSKAERLIWNDRLNALIEELENYCKVLLERFSELDQITDIGHDSPIMEAEKQSFLSLIFNADAIVLLELLEKKCGLEFTKLAARNYGHHVPSHVADTLSKRPPSSEQVDEYMVSIAKVYQVAWHPPMLPYEKAHVLSGILDPSALPRAINLDELRQICSKGVPKQPLWLRPRVWKLLLGTLPLDKDSWETEAHSKRQSYYALVRRLLTPIKTLPPPTTPLTALDTTLLQLGKSLTSLPHELDNDLESSPLCPLDNNAPEGLRIETAGALDERLKLIRAYITSTNDTACIPGIRVEISVTSPPDTPADNKARGCYGVSPDAFLTKNHTTSLLRLLYVHISLHPSAPTTYLTSLLIPLYVTMVQEIDPTELAHAEADTFWLFTELWGEVAEIAENGNSHEWMTKFGNRLAWADPQLWADLSSKGLDPALPHYSYRWLVPLLTHTLSLQSVLTIWDALFTRMPRTSDHNPKLEFLLDICTSMLIHARVQLFLLGKTESKPSGLWGDVDLTISPEQSTSAHVEEGFIQGMGLLQNYPMKEVGDPVRVIHTALSLDRRRGHPGQSLVTTPSLGERLRGTVWNGFTAMKVPTEPPIAELDDDSDGIPSPQWPDSGSEDGDVTETPGNTFLAKIGGTVWRGITNKSSMDVPPSPMMPSSPAASSSPSVAPDEGLLPKTSASDKIGIGNRISNSIWRGITNQSAMDDPPSPSELNFSSSSQPNNEGIVSPTSMSTVRSYTEKLRDSDAVATLSKVSSNWTAKATTLWGRNSASGTISSPEIPRHNARTGSLSLTGKSLVELLPKRGSLPTDIEAYSFPSRMNFTDGRHYTPGENPASPPRSTISLPSPPDLLNKSKSTLASLTGKGQGTRPKAGPRPLLLNSSSLITPSTSRRQSRSPTPTPRPPQPQRDSMSSVTSTLTSQSGALQGTSYSDRESEPGDTGRFVPLRRGTPIRPPPSLRPEVATKTHSTRRSVFTDESEPIHDSSTADSSRNSIRRNSSEEGSKPGWGRVDLPDSPCTLASSPPPRTPVTSSSVANVGVNDISESQRDRTVVNECGDLTQASQLSRRVVRKKSWNAFVQPSSPLEDPHDSSTSQEDHPQMRSKRYGRATNLRLKSDLGLGRSSPSSAIEQRDNGETSLAAESFADPMSTTPRAADFPALMLPNRPGRTRRPSRSPRRPPRQTNVPARGSGGEEGDDEGYDEFLSAYESEEPDSRAE